MAVIARDVRLWASYAVCVARPRPGSAVCLVPSLAHEYTPRPNFASVPRRRRPRGASPRNQSVFSRWPIRRKLISGLALLIVIVVTLSWGGIHGLYAYRGLIRSLVSRAPELPKADRLAQSVGDLRLALAEGLAFRGDVSAKGPLSAEAERARNRFRARLDELETAVLDYRAQIGSFVEDGERIGDRTREFATVGEIDRVLAATRAIEARDAWLFDDEQVRQLQVDLEKLQRLAVMLPTYLHKNIEEFTAAARIQYRTLIVLTGITSIATLGMFVLFVRLCYVWIFRPLRVLVKGSRKVAAGQFDHRIHLETHDEMSELAQAMNDMTARFRAIRDDLDKQVKDRTREVVRGEQMASVGFLAAGVAHEINNPLASIAMCAESLENRMQEQEPNSTEEESEPRRVIRNYLRMIQTEAFRCKEITEKLLDFSRTGEVRRQNTSLRELVQGVIDMTRHLGKYAGRTVEFRAGDAPLANVNPQEIKQVVLNLLTNALDSLDPGGAVSVELHERGGQAELVVRDNGCGMTPEVLEHLFEPFFTRRRSGQGTGLGLSISYRIVTDHQGTIDVSSEGPGRGSTFRVRLPVVSMSKEKHHRHRQQAA